jgi:hypothetical protein
MRKLSLTTVAKPDEISEIETTGEKSFNGEPFKCA